VEPFVKPLLERFSRQFRNAQYFCSHQDVELHAWARARAGRLVRGFAWQGENKRIIWDEGSPTLEERDLGLQFTSGLTAPDENSVMQLAYLWSIDPTGLNEQYKEPVLGILGNVAAG
jgi:hypothetical protein